MAFSARLICHRLTSRSSIWSRFVVANTRWMTTSTSPPCKSVISPSKIQKKSSPCLMLPPALDEGYNLYSLAQNSVLTLPQISKGVSKDSIHDLEFCGSSHGWIGLFNPHTVDLFIYNPISLRCINLPPINMLSNYPGTHSRTVKKLILTCSPDKDEQNCRVLIIYNCLRTVAFCSLQSNQWTPIDKMIDPYHEDGYDNKGSSYQDFVYSSRQNLFFGLTDSYKLQTWDLTDPSTPILIKKIDTNDDHDFAEQEWPGNNIHPERVSYLVTVEDNVLLLTRYVMHSVAQDGVDKGYSHQVLTPEDGEITNLSTFYWYPYMTVGFHVDAYDQEEDDLTGLNSLGDLALFIGNCSDSVALSVTNYPELKSDSIYFTDQDMDNKIDDEPVYLFGGHDIGIYNFENKTVSPCYYPCDRPNLKQILPSPMWFFPTLPV